MSDQDLLEFVAANRANLISALGVPAEYLSASAADIIGAGYVLSPYMPPSNFLGWAWRAKPRRRRLAKKMAKRPWKYRGRTDPIFTSGSDGWPEGREPVVTGLARRGARWSGVVNVRHAGTAP